MPTIEEIVDVVVKSIEEGGKILTFGVGGNAATAIHFAAELAGKYEQYETPLPCIDLCSNVSILTAITNDFGWEHVFERQIQALGKIGDVVIAFSISTKAEYLQKALYQAKVENCKVILICGKYTPELNPKLVDIRYEIGNTDTPKVQEEQLRLVHEICARVKSRL